LHGEILNSDDSKRKDELLSRISLCVSPTAHNNILDRLIETNTLAVPDIPGSREESRDDDESSNEFCWSRVEEWIQSLEKMDNEILEDLEN
jgi:hypothetical protein